jgi:hypothetical protein
MTKFLFLAGQLADSEKESVHSKTYLHALHFIHT